MIVICVPNGRHVAVVHRDRNIHSNNAQTWVFATSNGTKKLPQPLLSRFRVMYVNQYDFTQLKIVNVMESVEIHHHHILDIVRSSELTSIQI
jgi:MoxR-like ATPase